MTKKSNKNVIVVDDSEYIREKIKELVGSFEHCQITGEASDGDEAINVITTRKPDIVILDINMPKKTGIEVLRELKTIIHSICIIVISNYSETAYREKCLELGANYFLDKTKDFEKLKPLLKKL